MTAGGLTASVSPAPWHLELAHGSARVLSEQRETALGPTGTLGFATAGGWWHATRVLSERREGPGYVAELATTDPLGRTIAARVSPDADGVIQVQAEVRGVTTADVTQTGIAFAARGGERYLGFGERSNAVDQRGGTVENYVAEGPYQPDENLLIRAFVPAPGFHPRADATYFPVPWLLSTAGYGVLVDNDETSSFRLGSDRHDAWSVEVSSPRISLRVFDGPRPADALRRMTARTGRQPPAAAPFYFGPWFQPRDERESLAALAKADAPASVAQTYTHYLPCGDQRGRDEKARTQLFHQAGMAVTTYFNPMICTGYHPVYDEARARRALTRNALDQPHEYRYTGSSQFLVGQFDFSSPAGVGIFSRLLGEAVDAGYDGWMEDFGEYTPTDARSEDGTPGEVMHNRYPRLYHGAAYRYSRTAPRPLARFNRSGWTGTAAVSQIVWGGDPTTDWGFDGLQSAVRNGLTMGLSGVSLWGSDIGGYFSLLGRRLTPELLVRWIQVGAVSGVMRTQANGFSVPEGGRRPQIFDPQILPFWRRYAKLRTQLYPYLAAAQADYDRTGLPIMRHLALDYPDDPAATARDDEFLFGPDLLAAPVLAPGQRTRPLHLPRGRWIDLWRSAVFNSDGSPVLRGSRMLNGPRGVTLPAPLGELPLLVRAGAILPLLPADVDTLASYGKARGLVHLSDRARRRTLLAFPHGRSRSALGPGESLSSREGRRSWSLRVSGRVRRTYSLQASLNTLRRRFAPCSVRLGRRALPRRAWRYSRSTRVLRVRFKTRRGVVRVRGRCHRSRGVRRGKR